jgi:hypothetical protein
MKTDYATFTKILREATNHSVALYADRSSYPVPNAQENLSGRTHYVDSDTLKCFGARILSARPYMYGAFFVIVESSAKNYQKTQRGFRAVMFDIFGNTVYRPDIDGMHSTRAAAEKAFSKWYGEFDAETYYRDVLRERATRLQREANAAVNGAEALNDIINTANAA